MTIRFELGKNGYGQNVYRAIKDEICLEVTIAEGNELVIKCLSSIIEYSPVERLFLQKEIFIPISYHPDLIMAINNRFDMNIQLPGPSQPSNFSHNCIMDFHSNGKRPAKDYFDYGEDFLPNKRVCTGEIPTHVDDYDYT